MPEPSRALAVPPLVAAPAQGQGVAILTAPRTRGLVVAVALVGGWYSATRSSGPSVPMAPVRVGEFVDVVEVRGQVRPRTSIILTAPMQAGELQIGFAGTLLYCLWKLASRSRITSGV